MNCCYVILGYFARVVLIEKFSESSSCKFIHFGFSSSIFDHFIQAFFVTLSFLGDLFDMLLIIEVGFCLLYS